MDTKGGTLQGGTFNEAHPRKTVTTWPVGFVMRYVLQGGTFNEAETKNPSKNWGCRLEIGREWAVGISPEWVFLLYIVYLA